jgi:hypothetical protein
VNDYQALSGIIQASWTEWQSVQNSTIAGVNQVRKILSQARAQLRHAGQNASFLQISENSQYFTNLNEIRVTFENSFVDLQGFRPIITKLFQLMAQTEAVNKAEVRLKLLALFKKIKGEISNIRDEVEASRASQGAIFSAILESYKENLVRLKKLLERLNHEKTDLERDAIELAGSSKDSTLITTSSDEIFTERKRQCIAYVVEITKISVEVQKLRSIIAQLGETLEERFGNLKSYFLQREIKIKG